VRRRERAMARLALNRIDRKWAVIEAWIPEVRRQRPSRWAALAAVVHRRFRLAIPAAADWGGLGCPPRRAGWVAWAVAACRRV
jgi:hypothetical protein